MTTHHIPATEETVDASWGIQPGDVLMLEAGTRGRLRLSHLLGTVDAPIAVRTAGPVTIAIHATFTGLDIADCHYLYLYGDDLTIAGTTETNCGMVIRQMSDHVDIGGVEIHGPRAGIRCRTLIDAAPADWVQQEIYIHHCHVHDCATEAMYLGKGASQDPPGAPLAGLVVEHNRVERCAWDGIQVRNAPDAIVRHNTVKAIGSAGEVSIRGMGAAGLIIGEDSGGRWHDNRVSDTPRGIMLLHHAAGVLVDHNTLAHCPQAILAYTKALAVVHHNTVAVGYVQVPGAGTVRDNLIAEGMVDVGPDTDVHHNIETDTLDDARFVDWENGDYRLRLASPAVGAASDGGDCGAFPHVEQSLEDRVESLERKLAAVADVLQTLRRD